MMETAEDRGCEDAGAFGRPASWQVSGAVRRLHTEASVGSTVVVGHVVLENPLGVVLVLDDVVVEAVSPEGAYHPLAKRIGHGHARRRGEASRGRRGRHPQRAAPARIVVVGYGARAAERICKGDVESSPLQIWLHLYRSAVRLSRQIRLKGLASHLRFHLAAIGGISAQDASGD
jgi:hypothetical protein